MNGPSTGRFLSEDPIEFVTGAPYSYASNNPVIFADPFGLAPGDWWDPRTPGNFWSQWNPFNPNSGMSNTATSIWDSLSGMATGNWAQVAKSYDKGPYGQIGCTKCAARTAENLSLGGAGVAAGTAGGLILARLRLDGKVARSRSHGQVATLRTSGSIHSGTTTGRRTTTGGLESGGIAPGKDGRWKSHSLSSCLKKTRAIF